MLWTFREVFYVSHGQISRENYAGEHAKNQQSECSVPCRASQKSPFITMTREYESPERSPDESFAYRIVKGGSGLAGKAEPSNVDAWPSE